MNIGRLSISKDGEVSFDGQVVGRIAKLFVEQSAYGRSGSVSIFPKDRSLDMVGIARDLATNNLCVTFDFKESFWPNSFIKNDEWHIEIPSGNDDITQVIPLGISRAASSEPDLFEAEDLMISGY